MADIEIVSTKDFSDGSTFAGRAAGYGFALGSDGRYSSFKAKDGTQIAELNAETAGALYQDVMTIPNVSMSYWLSHRARGLDEDANHEYDSMYLVIMPSHIALTAAEDGGELNTQKDLEDFIEAHGGFSTAIAASEGDTVTYNRNSILTRPLPLTE